MTWTTEANRRRIFGRMLRATITWIAGASLIAGAASAQRTASRTSGGEQFKGIWEPVSYAGDIYLNDVLFVNPDVGWATSGRHGQGAAMIHTRDGGESWEMVLGDPESEEPLISHLHFLDERTGWALQYAKIGEWKLLHTSDGENWEQTGSIKTEVGLRGYLFLSETDGVYADGNDNVARIMRTSDGGRTWTEVFKCAGRVQVNGLTRDVQCSLNAIAFPTPEIGYAIGGAHGADGYLFVAKSTDGGRHWELIPVPDVHEALRSNSVEGATFIDADNGFVHFGNKLLRTGDGGRSWRGVIATPGKRIAFADPEVGWSFSSFRTMNYTANGGGRWSSRELPFPARVTAFSLPRRDRGYVVGDHGMVYRYRVIAAADPTPPNAIVAPAMPPFATPLEEQVEALESGIDELAGNLAASADSGADSSTGAATTACCTQAIDELQAATEALVVAAPQHFDKYRNLNLVIAGLRWASETAAYLGALKVSFAELRQATSATAVADVLAQIKTNIEGLSQTTTSAFGTPAP